MDTFILPLLRTLTTGALGAIALGVIGGSLLRALGAGAGSALLLPETGEGEGPTIYNTQMQPGRLSVTVDVLESKAGEIYLLLQSAGGQDVAAAEIPTQEALEPLGEECCCSCRLVIPSSRLLRKQ